MIILGRPEARGRDDLGHDILSQRGRGFGLGSRRLLHLRLIGRIDGGAVGKAAIAELPAGIERIDRAEEGVDQLVVAHPRRIEFDQHGFAMAILGMVLIGGVFVLATDIARGGRNHARHLVEIRFDTPESSRRRRWPARGSLRERGRRAGQSQRQGEGKCAYHHGSSVRKPITHPNPARFNANVYTLA